jgi:hypothetical protein
MDGAALSVGSIASVGLAVGASASVASTAAAATQTASTTNPTDGATASPSSSAADVVVSFSDAALRALELDAAAVLTGGMPSRVAEDLAALALLAILQRDQQQTALAAAAAVTSYLAVQALISA